MSTFYISIITSSALVLSEILPLLPIKQNGLIHSLILLFKSSSVQQSTDNSITKDIEIIKNNLSDITKRLDTLEIV